MKHFTLEICCNSLQSALHAQTGGADRVELCCNLENGGLTPSAGTIQRARELLNIDLFVLIRPRRGHFCYSPKELEQMAADIFFCKKEGVDGVVFGVLDKQQQIDKKANQQLLELTGSMQTTFHRAIDEVDHLVNSVAILTELGFHRVLTSGGASKAPYGVATIAALVKKYHPAISILAASGINSENVGELIRQTGIQEIHASAKKESYAVAAARLFKNNYWETDLVEVQRLRQQLDKIGVELEKKRS